MLSIGEQLYRLTARDRSTLLVEPFYRDVNATAFGAATFATINVPFPVDRMLYIDRITFHGLSWVGAITWFAWFAAVQGPGLNPDYRLFQNGANAAVQLLTDGTASSVANQEVWQQKELKLIVPPGYNNLQFQAFTPAKAVDATFQVLVSGYLIPPGEFGRR